MLDALRKSFAMLPPHHRRRWLLLVPLAVVIGIAETLAASAIFVLLRLMTNPSATLAAGWVSELVRRLPRRDPTSVLLAATAALGAIYLVKSALVLASEVLRHRVVHSSSAFLASEMLRRYLAAPYPFHFRRNSAQLIHNCTASVDAVLRTGVGAAVGALGDLLMSAGLLAVVLRTSPGASVIAAVAIAAVMVVTLRVTRRTAWRLGSESYELTMAMLQGLQQALAGIKELKVLGRERFFYDEFVARQRLARLLGDMGLMLGNAPSLISQTLLVVGGLALIAVLALLGVGGLAAVPIAGVFGYAAARLLPMGGSIVAAVNGIRGSQRAADELYDDFVTLSGALPGGDTASDAEPLVFTDRIALHDVSYVYPGSASAALADVSLEIRRGESIGIVGATGAGKSTLIDVVLGLLPPTRGRIAVDHHDLPGGRAPWRRGVGYVPQSLFLIDDTLRRNIALGVPDRDIDDGRVRRVVAMAQLEHFVDDLPDGLDARLGERGIRLSGGERQRVAIARALYHDPHLIVFDEATSSLDMETEAAVMRSIDRLHGVKTTIVVAHRLSTVRHCARIVWLRAGRVAGIGSFEELQRASDDFRELAALASV